MPLKALMHCSEVTVRAHAPKQHAHKFPNKAATRYWSTYDNSSYLAHEYVLRERMLYQSNDNPIEVIVPAKGDISKTSKPPSPPVLLVSEEQSKLPLYPGDENARVLPAELVVSTQIDKNRRTTRFSRKVRRIVQCTGQTHALIRPWRCRSFPVQESQFQA
ncbi:hypothetical protein BC835DRAFT_1099832 [Cytidiella melzeri]|nr:hypothetical protein BC835DRAFT_1099832 [Cytidiella melzeri]